MSEIDGMLKQFKDGGMNIPDENNEALIRKNKLHGYSNYYNLKPNALDDLRTRAVKLGLIPEIYKNASFDQAAVKHNITALQNKDGRKFVAVNTDEYFKTVEGIIGAIRSRRLPDRSYLIGAPNSFGKQSFAVDCIIASLNNGWLTVPYISLLELAEIKTANDKVLMRGLMGLKTDITRHPFNYTTGEYSKDGEYLESYYSYMGDEYTDVKSPTVITGRYSWSEYINAPVLICFFSGIENKAVESNMLYTLLAIRSAKGFPTIVTISTSLQMYERDPVIGRFIWNEIKSYDKDIKAYDRIVHISCYKNYSPFDGRR